MKINTILYMPDGNRRFARKNQISLDEAYYLGGKTLKLFSEFFIIGGISDRLIFHAMSDYTHERTDNSLDSIYNSLIQTFEELINERFFEKNKINFKWIDHSGKIPEKLGKELLRLSQLTKNQKNRKVVTLLGYSLEEDINQSLSHKPKDYASFRKHLLFPDIDLVIRTKEMRVSGGPVYAMAQSQMITLDKLNPEVKREDLEKISDEFSGLKDYRRELISIINNHTPLFPQQMRL